MKINICRRSGFTRIELLVAFAVSENVEEEGVRRTIRCRRQYPSQVKYNETVSRPMW